MDDAFYDAMPRLGFGAMRMPTTDGDVRHVDMPQVEAMVDEFLRHGYRYFDTAWVYHDGLSEQTIAQALVDRHPRDSFYLADKCTGWCLKDGFGPEDMFKQQLQRCRVGYFDFYLLHSVDQTTIGHYDRYGCWQWLAGKKASGQVRHIGFSFHGDPAMLERLLTAHPEIEFVQLQINYIDWDDARVQAGANYQVARRHGKRVNVMEPVKGGILANLTDSCRAIYTRQDPAASLASWALRYVASLDGLNVVLSGMSTLAQVRDNVATMDAFRPLTGPQREAIAQVVNLIHQTPTYGCTSCKYCLAGCPRHINIPRYIRTINEIKTFGDSPMVRDGFQRALTQSQGRPADCIACGQCEGVCPQHLPIISILRQVHETFE